MWEIIIKLIRTFLKKTIKFIKKVITWIKKVAMQIKETAIWIKNFIISLFTEYWIITWCIITISFTWYYIDFYNRLRPLKYKYLIFGYIIILIILIILYIIVAFLFSKHWDRDYSFFPILLWYLSFVMLVHLANDGDWSTQVEDGMMLLGRFYEANLRLAVTYMFDTQNEFWVWLNIRRILWGFSPLESAPIYFHELDVPIRFALNPNYEHFEFLGQKIIKYTEHFDGHNVFELLPGETLVEVMKHDDAVREMLLREEYIRTGRRLPHYSRLYRD